MNQKPKQDDSWLDYLSDSPLNVANYPGYAFKAAQFGGNALSNIAASMSPVRFQEGEDAGFYPQVPPMITETAGAWDRLFGEQDNWHDGPGEVYPGDMNADAATAALAFYGGNALNPLAVKPAGSVGMFAGRKAKTADHVALSKAEQMSASGADKNAVWNETGWFQGPDKQWRFEIDDSGAKRYALTNPFYGDPGFASRLMDHEEFFKAYPQAKEDLVRRMTPIEAKRYYGAINTTVRPDGRMYMKHNPKLSDEDYLSTQLHEFQHGVQVREGFSPGTNPKLAGSLENYLKTAGEVEARNVQKRQKMTTAERLETPPWLTQDFPYESQLFSDNKPSIMGMAAGSADQHPLARRPAGSIASGVAREAPSLPMDHASRLARAKEQGFDTETPFYRAFLRF